jgi:hypothetical protein
MMSNRHFCGLLWWGVTARRDGWMQSDRFAHEIMAILRFGSCAASDACGVGEGRLAAELDCCPTSETPLQRHKMSTFWAERNVFAIMIVSAFSMRYWLLIEGFIQPL